jgi:DNA-directed RNA polymerase specialized sigma24 family protein
MYLQEKTDVEIAQLTGWGRPLVRVRAFRARQKLKQGMNRLSARENAR